MPKVLDKQWKVLEKAKKHLSYEPIDWRMEGVFGQFTYICHAISYVVTESYFDEYSKRFYVQDLLEECDSLEEWLVKNDYAT